MDNEARLYVSFGSWVHDIFVPAIQSYSDIIIRRIVPMFDDVDGEAKCAAEEVMAWSGWGEDDYDRAMETAHEHSLERAWQFMELRSVFLATGVSGLFHLFEKQVCKHLNHELNGWLCSPITEWKDATDIIRKLKRFDGDGQGNDLVDAIDDTNVKELRLVANAIKHGEGHSLDKLRKIGAVVVSDTRLEEDCNVGPYSILGVAVSIRPEDIIRYRDSIIRFWKVSGTFFALRSDFT